MTWCYKLGHTLHYAYVFIRSDEIWQSHLSFYFCDCELVPQLSRRRIKASLISCHYYWNCDFPKNLPSVHIGWSLGWLVRSSVCNNFLNGRKFTLSWWSNRISGLPALWWKILLKLSYRLFLWQKRENPFPFLQYNNSRHIRQKKDFSIIYYYVYRLLTQISTSV